MTDAEHSRRLEAWSRLTEQKSAVLGGGFFLVILTVVLLGPLVWTLDPQLVDIRDRKRSDEPRPPPGYGISSGGTCLPA